MRRHLIKKTAWMFIAVILAFIISFAMIQPASIHAQETTASEEWLCPECGETNAGNFCGNCGTARPESGEWTCPDCGVKNTGKFCTNCGAAKAEADTPQQEKEPDDSHVVINDDPSVLYIENDDGTLEYAGFEMNNKNFHKASSNDEYENVIVLKFNYTNKTSDEKEMQDDFSVKAYQNGVEMDSAGAYTVTDTLPKEVDNYYQSVIKGGTICAGRAYVPVDDSPITIIATAIGDSANKEKDDMVLEWADEAAATVSEDPEEIDKLLQGSWIYQTDDNSFTFTDGSVVVITQGESLTGSYTVNTEEDQIDLKLTATDGIVNAHLPYTLEDETLILFNSQGEALEKRDEPIEEKEPEISTEELEAAIDAQPVRVFRTEVTDNTDDRFDLSYNTGVIIPHIINGSGEDIKDLQVYFVAWDQNDLPVTLQSSMLNYKAGYVADVMFNGVNLIPGAKLNEDDADTFLILPFNTTCNVKKAKAIVGGYRTFSGETWVNPLLEQWGNIFGGVKYSEAMAHKGSELSDAQDSNTAMDQAPGSEEKVKPDVYISDTDNQKVLMEAADITPFQNTKEDRYIIATVKNNSSSDVKSYQIGFLLWDEAGKPIMNKVTREFGSHYVFSSSYSGKNSLPANSIKCLTLDNQSIGSWVINPDGTSWFDPVYPVYVLAVVYSFESSDGESWTNPYFEEWMDKYAGKSISEINENIPVYDEYSTVVNLQNALNAAGYDCGPADGDYGTNTANAAKGYLGINYEDLTAKDAALLWEGLELYK